MQLPNVLHYVGMMRRYRWVIGMYLSLVYTLGGGGGGGGGGG